MRWFQGWEQCADMERAERAYFEIKVEHSAGKNVASAVASRGRVHQRAFTMNELLIILAVVGIIFVLLPQYNRSKRRGHPGNCVNNLKNVGLAFRIFATDHNDQFPMQVSTNEGGVKELMFHATNAFRAFQSLSNEVQSPRGFRCPLDSRVSATNMLSLQQSNVSYFVGLDANEENPSVMLSGDRNLQAKIPKMRGRILQLSTNDYLGWKKEMHWADVLAERRFSRNKTPLEERGTVVKADGSVHSLTTSGLQKALRESGLATNRFMLPD